MRQVHVELTEQLYKQAKRRTVEAEFKSVEEYRRACQTQYRMAAKQPRLTVILAYDAIDQLDEICAGTPNATSAQRGRCSTSRRLSLTWVA